MTDQRQKQIEIECCTDPANLIGTDGSVRSYWQDMKELIRACDGVNTNLIFVEHRREGSVHGYPVTEGRLRRIGVNI